jgi:hypothetical protein
LSKDGNKKQRRSGGGRGGDGKKTEWSRKNDDLIGLAAPLCFFPWIFFLPTIYFTPLCPAPVHVKARAEQTFAFQNG